VGIVGSVKVLFPAEVVVAVCGDGYDLVEVGKLSG
jgi:hypothetical protein